MIGAGILFALASFRFAIVPALVRAAWKAPRRRELHTPADLHLPFHQVFIETVRGKRLHAWWLTESPGAPNVILLHGWGGNAESMLPVAQRLVGAGLNCLLVDARNHGLSDEDGFSSMVKFAEDLDHAIAWLKKRTEITSPPIALIGHSVGAAAALLCASRRDDIAAVISIAAFAHPGEVMRQMMSARHIPHPLVWWVLRHIERTIGARYDDIAPTATITRITAPVLLVHGTRDRTIPVEDATAIHTRRASDETRLLLVPGGHFDIAALQSRGDELDAFLAGAFRRWSRRPVVGES